MCMAFPSSHLSLAHTHDLRKLQSMLQPSWCWKSISPIKPRCTPSLAVGGQKLCYSASPKRVCVGTEAVTRQSHTSLLPKLRSNRTHADLSLRLGRTCVDGLAMALGHDLDETLTQQLADGSPGKAAVDLQVVGRHTRVREFVYIRILVDGGEVQGMVAAQPWLSQGKVHTSLTLNLSHNTEGVIILYFGTSVNSLSYVACMNQKTIIVSSRSAG
jgi:hypothetical protein